MERDGPASKARPCLVVQTERAGSAVPTVTVCPLTSTLGGRPLFRPKIAATPENGLHIVSEIEVDRIFSPNRRRIGGRIGAADPATMKLVDEAMRRWLDL